MEILQFLLYFLLEEYGGEELYPLLEIMKENNFDLIKTLKTVSPDKLAPIIKKFLSKNKGQSEKSDYPEKLSIIKNIADEKILNMLNAVV